MTPAMLGRGHRLRQARIASGYATAKDFALAHGLAISTYTQWEQFGRLTLGDCETCAALLNVRAAWLTFGEGCS